MCIIKGPNVPLASHPLEGGCIGGRRVYPRGILVERESHLLELCRYVVLNPLRIKGKAKIDHWKWSSYQATAGMVPVPEFLTVGWVLSQFGKSRSAALPGYRAFVREGLERKRSRQGVAGGDISRQHSPA
jgi:hypothetical protein